MAGVVGGRQQPKDTSCPAGLHERGAFQAIPIRWQARFPRLHLYPRFSFIPGIFDVSPVKIFNEF